MKLCTQRIYKCEAIFLWTCYIQKKNFSICTDLKIATNISIRTSLILKLLKKQSSGILTGTALNPQTNLGVLIHFCTTQIFLSGFLKFSVDRIVSSASGDLSSSFPTGRSFVSLPGLLALSRASLKRSGESGDPGLTPHPRGRASGLWSVSAMVYVWLHQEAFLLSLQSVRPLCFAVCFFLGRCDLSTNATRPLSVDGTCPL